MLGVDYPWTHPDPADLQTAGVGFALRYLSNDPSKNLSRSEADALAAAGVWCGVIWETTAGRALAGRAAGAADARAALAQAQACGMPDGRPIYFAVDTDTSWPMVAAYFLGICDVLSAAQVGVYGGIQIIQGAAASGLVTWFWQTLAWSGGRWDQRAHIRQTGSITVGGVDCDRNESTTTDFGQWMPGRTPIPEEDIVTPQDIQAIAQAVQQAVVPATAQAVWDHQVPVPRLQDDGSVNYAAQQAAVWPQIWGNVWTARILKAVAAQQAALSTLITQLGAAHPGVDTATVVAAVEQAIAAAVVHVDVNVTTPSSTNS